jgi:hypothetical protein
MLSSHLFLGKERRHQVASTPASYSGGPEFKSRLGTGYSEDFRGFTQSLQTNSGIEP